LLLGNKPLTTGANVNLYKSAVVCIAAVAICGKRGQHNTAVHLIAASFSGVGSESLSSQ
jgi:hypothetical protein